MQGPSNSNAVASASVPPLTVVDVATLARVAGGSGPHGGWSAPSSTAAPKSALETFGPHGGWRFEQFGPHGGW